MFTRLTLISALSAAVLAACATPQENPYYKYSSQYKGGTTSVVQASTTIETAPVNYQTVSYDSGQATYTRVNHECLKKEKNHELLGGAIGGTVGAIAGEKIIGGTEGVALGAVIGGAAGYGIGDKAVNCDPQTVIVEQPMASAHQSTSASYQGASTSYQQGPIIAEPYVSPTDSEFATISDIGTPGYQVLQAQTVEIYEAPAAMVSETSGNVAAQQVSYDYSQNTITASAETVAMPSETRILGALNYDTHTVKEGDTVYSLSRQRCIGIADIQSMNGLSANYGIKIGDTLQLPSSIC